MGIFSLFLLDATDMNVTRFEKLDYTAPDPLTLLTTGNFSKPSHYRNPLLQASYIFNLSFLLVSVRACWLFQSSSGIPAYTAVV